MSHTRLTPHHANSMHEHVNYRSVAVKYTLPNNKYLTHVYMLWYRVHALSDVRSIKRSSAYSDRALAQKARRVLGHLCLLLLQRDRPGFVEARKGLRSLCRRDSNARDVSICAIGRWHVDPLLADVMTEAAMVASIDHD